MLPGFADTRGTECLLSRDRGMVPGLPRFGSPFLKADSTCLSYLSFFCKGFPGATAEQHAVEGPPLPRVGMIFFRWDDSAQKVITLQVSDGRHHEDVASEEYRTLALSLFL